MNKVKSEIMEIKNDIEEAKNELNGKISVLKEDTTALKNDKAVVKLEIAALKEYKRTWSLSKNKILDNIYCPNKKVYQNLERKQHKTGRPVGGLSFLVDNNLKCQVKFISDRIGQIKIGKLIILNIYLPYYTGKTDDYQDYDQKIENLQEILEVESHNNLILVGDFNTDIIRSNHNTVSLLKFLKTNNLTMADVKQHQKINFTLQISWIDHVICRNEMLSKLTTEILYNESYLVDHNAINITKKDVDLGIEKRNERTHPKIIKLRWLNSFQLKRYKEILSDKIKIVGDLTVNLENIRNKETLKIKLTEVLNNLSSLMIQSVKQVNDEITKMSKEKKEK
ncbi:unnamed protein product [Brachionus calyciflorus]|uniref:Endonuclease/exonuclease/phosphatase domain-containing protein n=1 Tax=Brachionus calyciflorus TaxID=104777 RepID=A0A814MED9_9BILA|nr:unnamed protein product [Brachionus calyciflorus]